MAKTIQDAAQMAIDVQDASNLSGVVLSFGRLLTEAIRDEMDRLPRGTNFRNNHPIAVAFADKIVSLTRCYDQDFTAGTHALHACEAIAAAADFAEVDAVYAVWDHLQESGPLWDAMHFRTALAAYKHEQAASSTDAQEVL